ncbi:MAG: hypothetical protein M3338_05835 [Actinomycetota bacterium]|nr:hypothetical protein [Actinomycetota bacterium]
MRGGILWALGTALAFVLTATAFLLLAGLFTTSPERSLAPPGSSGDSNPSLDLDLDQGQLAALGDLPDQSLDLTVRNGGEEQLSNISLTLKVTSENTALTEARYYRATVDELAVGTSRNVGFVLDLSPLAVPGGAVSPEDLEAPQTIVEIQATTPKGISAVRTVILPLQADS